ncbi:MAG: HlyD family type I secretion periplasmic adaptor subunit [Spirochaetota bacterium]
MKPGRREGSQRSLLERSTLLNELEAPPLAGWAIAFGILAVVLFLIWASFAVVEEVAQAPGLIGGNVEAARVQHPTGGVVAQVLVREGSEVSSGDTLLVFDPVDTNTALAQSRTERISLQSQRIKLNALLSGKRANFSQLGEIALAVADQKRLYESELEATTSKETILRIQAAQKRSELDSLDARTAAAGRQLTLAREDLAIRSSLAERGTIPRTQVIAVEREVANIEAEVKSIPSVRSKTLQELAEIDARRTEYHAERVNRYSDELASVNVRLAQLDETEKNLLHGAGSLEVRSPIDGYILGLAVAGKGEVVRSGTTIASIVPKEKGYRAEIRVSPKDIGAIQPGLRVRLKISAYPFDRFGGFKGRISEVSASTLTGNDGAPYYRSIATVEGRELAKAEPLALIPGMVLTAEIVTGERTIMQYILKPIFASAQEAFRER